MQKQQVQDIIEPHGSQSLDQRNTLVIHEDNLLSYRIDGVWTRNVRKIATALFLKLPKDDRDRLTYLEYELNRSLAEGTRLIIGKAAATI